MLTLDFNETLGDFMDQKLRGVHISVPAKVIKVNYAKNLVDVKVMIEDAHSDEKSVDYPELIALPILNMGCGNGEGRLTFPVKAGDMVVVLFADRSLNTFFNSNGVDSVRPDAYSVVGMYPFGVMFNVAMPSSAKAIESDKAVLEYKDAKVYLKEDGSISVFNKKGKIDIDANGKVLVGNDNGDITIEPQGDVKLQNNGSSLVLNTSGNAQLSNATTSVTISASGQVDIKGAGGSSIQTRTDGSISLNNGTVTNTGDYITPEGISQNFHTHTYFDDGRQMITSPPIR